MWLTPLNSPIYTSHLKKATKAAPIRSVTVNGKGWKDFDATRELVRLSGVAGRVAVTVSY